MLERVILFLEEVRGVPVLLSMLVLLFKHREEGSTEPLPASRYDLYEMATRLAAKEENVLRMLRHIAAANQLAGSLREFTTVQAEDALQKLGEEELSLWRDKLRSESGVPLIKTLVDAGGGSDGVYQYRHLSFQEGLFVAGLLMGEIEPENVWPSKERAVEFLKSNANVCRIGSGRLGDKLLPVLANEGVVDLKGKDVGVVSGQAIAELLTGSSAPITWRLDLSENMLGTEGAQLIAAALGSNSSLEHLELAGNILGGHYTAQGFVPDLSGVTALAEALKQNGTLAVLDLRSNHLGDAAKKQLQDASLGRAIKLQL